MARESRRPNRKKERRYQHSIPSRNDIAAVMESAGQPLTLAALATKLRIKPGSPSESLQKRLRAMVRDGQLLRNRAREYCLTRDLDLVTGVIQAHRDGFGFLAPDDGPADV